MFAFTCKWSQILIVMLIPIATRATYSSTVDYSIDPSIKCGECPCLNPCSQQPRPFQPPSPPPPPLYCSPPPPPPPPPPTQFCSPPAFVPPPPRFIYVAGNLYPTNNDPFNLQIYSRVAHTAACTFLLLGCSVLQLLVFF